jgi:hypothetical protein
LLTLSISENRPHHWHSPIMGHPKYSGPGRFAFNCGRHNQFFVMYLFEPGQWTQDELILLAKTMRHWTKYAGRYPDLEPYLQLLLHTTATQTASNRWRVACAGTKEEIIMHALLSL